MLPGIRRQSVCNGFEKKVFTLRLAKRFLMAILGPWSEEYKSLFAPTTIISFLL